MIKFRCHFHDIYKQWKRESANLLTTKNRKNSGIPDSPRSKFEAIRTLPTSTQAAGDVPPTLPQAFQSKAQLEWRVQTPPIHRCAAQTFTRGAGEEEKPPRRPHSGTTTKEDGMRTGPAHTDHTRRRAARLPTSWRRGSEQEEEAEEFSSVRRDMVGERERIGFSRTNNRRGLLSDCRWKWGGKKSVELVAVFCAQWLGVI
jgi:hypothetical protein